MTSPAALKAAEGVRYLDKWLIYPGTSLFGPWLFVHDDYDGAEDAYDMRHGQGESVEDCKEQIRWLEEDLWTT